MASIKAEVGTLQTMLSTELNSIATNAGAISTTAFDNSLTANLWLFGDFELVVTFATAPTANTTVDLYLLSSLDATNYGDATTIAPAIGIPSHFIGAFPLRNITTAQRILLPTIAPIRLPPTLIKLQAINRSGQAFPASGSTIKMLPSRYQN